MGRKEDSFRNWCTVLYFTWSLKDEGKKPLLLLFFLFLSEYNFRIEKKKCQNQTTKEDDIK